MPKRKTRPKDTPKTLDTTLFCYLEKDNAKFAKKEGKKLFGSYSAYINALIAKDRGAEPKLGAWKAAGESKALRQAPKAEVRKEIPTYAPPSGPGSPNYRDPVV